MQISPEKIKQFRKDKGWSQEVLAKASGLSLRTIQRIERDGSGSLESQLALASAFDTSPKALLKVAEQPDVEYKGINIVQSLLALVLVMTTFFLLIKITGEFNMYIDATFFFFVILFTLSCTVISFGITGLLKSLAGFKYIFSSHIEPTPACQLLEVIYKKQITFLYGGAATAFLVGAIAIHSHFEVESAHILHPAYALNLVVLFYATFIAEGVLRPLIAKLENAALIDKFK